MNAQETPKIFVLCLRSYNNGFYHGEWINANADADDIFEDIESMLKRSPSINAGDWLIAEYKGFYGVHINEHENLETVSELAQAIAQHGEDGEAVALYFSRNQTIANYEESYVGKYDSESEYVYELLEDNGAIAACKSAGIDSYYINFESIAEDWEINGDFYSIKSRQEQKVYIFR